MKNRAKRISIMAVGVFAFALCLPVMTRAQESKPAPEAPQPESPRNDPPPSPPAEAPRNDPPPSPPSGGGGSSNNNDNSGSRNNDSSRTRDNDSGRRNPDNDNRRNVDNGNRRNNDDDNRRGNEKPASGNREVGGGIPGVENPTFTNTGGGNRGRGSMSGDGSSNRRDRTIETEDGQIVPGGRGVAPIATSGGTGGGGARTGGGGSGVGTNPGGGRGGGNPGGGGNDRHRDHGRDGDRHGRHGGRDGHRHYRGDECYQVPTYDDTISYSSSNYPVYDADDSLSAYDRGYNDGLYTGANDGRRGQIYDPERSHFYKSADHGYRSIKGPRDIYRQAYRDGFLRGYREGFQDWRHYFVNGTFIRR